MVIWWFFFLHCIKKKRSFPLSLIKIKHSTSSFFDGRVKIKELVECLILIRLSSAKKNNRMHLYHLNYYMAVWFCYLALLFTLFVAVYILFPEEQEITILVLTCRYWFVKNRRGYYFLIIHLIYLIMLTTVWLFT